ncbi:ABC transporter related protein [uncultured Desulfatiglans sp.]|nr:ABC transporter related protein [uncultured Desulfatiglans sp.]
MLDVKKLGGNLGGFTLHDIDLKVPKGEYFSILGSTGAGKTVLIEYIAGIYKPDNGTILVDGEDVTSLYPEERNIGYVPQDYALFPNLTVEKNIAYGLEARRMPADQIAQVVSEMISLLRIDYIRHRMPLNLSGGEKQRVALGRALATDPRLLLLDEPLSALDENLRGEMAKELRQIQRKVNATFIHVCHNFEEAADVSDRVAIMDGGRLVQIGTLKEIMSSPKNAFVARFVKSQNIFPAESDGSVIRIGEHRFEKNSPFKGRVIAVVRPEHIEVLESENGNEKQGVVVTVTHTLEKPYFNEITVDGDMPLVIHTSTERVFHTGDRVRIHIPPEHMMVMND